MISKKQTPNCNTQLVTNIHLAGLQQQRFSVDAIIEMLRVMLREMLRVLWVGFRRGPVSSFGLTPNVTLPMGGENQDVGESKQQNKTTSAQIYFSQTKNSIFQCVCYDSLPEVRHCFQVS